MELKLETDPNTVETSDTEIGTKLKIYESSVRHGFTGDALLSIAVKNGRGVRLNLSQVRELRDFLSEWLAQ